MTAKQRVGNGLGFQGKKRLPSVDERSQRITALLPLVSGLRHARDPAARACAVVLQASVRDLERLNDVEAWCERVDGDLSRRDSSRGDSSRGDSSRGDSSRRDSSRRDSSRLEERSGEEIFVGLREILSKE
jgi:hypothetical protein